MNHNARRAKDDGKATEGLLLTRTLDCADEVALHLLGDNVKIILFFIWN